MKRANSVRTGNPEGILSSTSVSREVERSLASLRNSKVQRSLAASPKLEASLSPAPGSVPASKSQDRYGFQISERAFHRPCAHFKFLAYALHAKIQQGLEVEREVSTTEFIGVQRIAV
jgi:hypothetical protein